jgi:hypothetical protein
MATTASIPVGYQDDGADNQKLPVELENALRSLVQHVLGLEKWPRRQEVMLARLQRFYERGDQHIYWNARSWVFAQVSGGSSVQIDDSSVDMPHYVADYNIYGPYERSLVAILAQNPPGVNFIADDPNSSVDISSAKAAEKFRHHVDKCNPRKKLQSDITRLFCTDGRVVLWTRCEKSAARFGYDDNQEPNEGELITCHGVLESKVPLTLCYLEEWPYAGLSDEMDITVAKHRYEFAAKKIQEGSGSLGESSYERFARLGVLQGTRSLTQVAEAYKHLVTRNTVWLRPCSFIDLPDDTKEELERIFPKGVRVTFVGGAYCGAVAETMDDHIAVSHPLPGDGQNRPSLLKPLISIQDSFNDLMNLSKEIYDYCVPSVWMSESVMDPESLREQVSEPGAYRQGKKPTGEPFANQFFVEQLEHVPPDMMESMNNLSGQLAQFVTGALPALFGGSMEDQKTASGYALAREQAMGQLGISWGALQELYAKAYEQACKCAAQRMDQEEIVNVEVPGQRGEAVEQVAIKDLAEGSFHCHPDNDSSFPETTAGKRNAVMQLIELAVNAPELAGMLWQPKNVEMIKEWMGMEDLEMPSAAAYEKQMQEIDQLLKTTPVPPSPQEEQQFEQSAEMAAQSIEQGGMPPAPPQIPQPQPSVPVDPIYDMHQLEFEAVQDWINSSEGQEQKVTNPAGFENVRLHGLEHQKYMGMMAPPAPMGGGPGAPPPGGQPPAPGAPQELPIPPSSGLM